MKNLIIPKNVYKTLSSKLGWVYQVTHDDDNFDNSIKWQGINVISHDS